MPHSIRYNFSSSELDVPVFKHAVATWRAPFLVFVSALILFFPVFLSEVYSVNINQTDFPSHIEIAKHIWSGGILTVPHFLFHLLLILTVKIIPWIDWSLASATIATISFAICAVLIFRILPIGSSLVRGLISLLLVLLGPINFFGIATHHLYFGFLAPTAYHNPTIVLLRPLALAHFLIIGHLVLENDLRWRPWLLSTIILIIGALAKPSYLMCALPASIVLAFFIRDGAIRLRLVMIIVIPGLIILLWQYYFVQAGTGDYSPTTFILAPFAAMRNNSERLAWKLLASIAFPLVLYIFFRKRFTTDRSLLFASLLFIFGALWSYLPAETGPRGGEMNFVWSGEIAIWILMVQSVRTLLKQPRSTARRICFGVLGLHVLGGIVWYGAELFSQGKFF